MTPQDKRGGCHIRIVHVVVLLVCLLGGDALSSSSSSSATQRRRASPPIVACASNVELERAITVHVRSGDEVIELGAQFAGATQKLCRTVGEDGHAVLVGLKRGEAKSGRNPNRDTTLFQNKNSIDILEIDELRTWRREIFSGDITHRDEKEIEFDAVILDLSAITGNDLPWTSLELVNSLLECQTDVLPRVILVKSNSLSNLARRLIHSQRLLDGSSQLSRSIKRSHEPFIIATVGVDEYRRTIPYTVQAGDCCLEVGCHFGRTTRLLHDAAAAGERQDGGCLGVDIGPKIIASAKKQYPDIPFAVGDCWRTLELLQLKNKLTETSSCEASLGYDVVYADIGGLSGPDALLESLSLLDSLGNALEPRCIVIKSLCMKRLASRLCAFSDIWATLQKESIYQVPT